MSTQSIIHSDLQLLSDNTDKIFICMAEKYMMSTKYGVGKSYNKKDFKKLLWMDRVLCENHCRLDNVKNKIKEKLNLLTIKYI